jgi:hypothetical protein
MRQASLVLKTVALLLSMSVVVEASWLSKAWKGATDVVAAPVRGVGWLIGQGAKEASDPVFEGAASRTKEVIDHGADRINGVLTEQVKSLNTMADDRIKQVNELLDKELKEADRIIAKNLDEFDKKANAAIDHVAKVLDDEINRVDKIIVREGDRLERVADKTVGGLERIAFTSLDTLDRSLNKNLTRLQAIESDAFDRIDAALQDQVPLAAGQVTRNLEWTIVILIFAFVLIGYGGIALYHSFMTEEALALPLATRARASIRQAAHSLLLVGVPMLLIMSVIQISYLTYCNYVDYSRIYRLEEAASLFEAVGDYRSAIGFRKRALTLQGTPNRRYAIERDQLLADLTQSFSRPDLTELSLRHKSLREIYASQSENDPEIQGASIYLSFQLSSFGNQNLGSFPQSIKEYKSKFLSPAATNKRPNLGKLVYITEIRYILNATDSLVSDKLTRVKSVAEEALASYPNSAPLLLARAQSTALLEVEAKQTGISKLDVAAAVEDKISQDISNATMYDPDLVRMVRFASESLPPDLLESLANLAATAVPADKDPKKANYNSLKEATTRSYDKFIDHLRQIAQPIIAADTLLELEVRRRFDKIFARDASEKKLYTLIEEARKAHGIGADVPSKQFPAYRAVIKQAKAAERYDVAEQWIGLTKSLIKDQGNAIPDGDKQALDADAAFLRKAQLGGALIIGI